ncbi:hypothetical protein [Cellulosilyticum ruminicola]|nr:hypothetical protein [Cellulosilyticum ruminicola]
MDKFRSENFKEDIMPAVYISGCQNSCGVQQIARIGFMGKVKRVDG